MGRRGGSAADASDVSLNMTPMIDCVFQLLIFFMVCTDLSQKEIEQILLPNAEKSIEDKGDEEEKRVIINIAKAKDYATTKNVSIKVKGQEYNLEKLKEILFTNAEIKRDENDPNRPSEIYVLLRCDEEIRWREVQWVMQACADPAVRIYKLQFATREHKK